jgi:hypothetical protein
LSEPFKTDFPPTDLSKTRTAFPASDIPRGILLIADADASLIGTFFFQEEE